MGIQRNWGGNRQQREPNQSRCQFKFSINNPNNRFIRRKRRSNRSINELLRLTRHGQRRKLYNSRSWGSISIFPDISRTRYDQSDDHSKNYRDRKRNRYNQRLYTIGKKLCLLLALSANAIPAYAESVGGVSATANPIANSSGSVTNQAIQVLQGPYITNTYGGGIQCQGPTMNITPYVTGTGAFKRPFESHFDDPVYDMSDLNDDGVLDNPGDVLYYVPTRTGQQEIYNLSLGLSATWSRPLDKTLQNLCKTAAATQIGLQKQLTANKRLDFEIARLKNCGELMKAGIMFHPKSPFASVCADVVLTNPVGVVANHTHGLQPNKPVVVEPEPVANGKAEDLGIHTITNTSVVITEEEVPSSSDTHSHDSPEGSAWWKFYQGWRLPWSKPALSQDEIPVEEDQLEVLQVGQMHQPQSQSPQSSSQSED